MKKQALPQKNYSKCFLIGTEKMVLIISEKLSLIKSIGAIKTWNTFKLETFWFTILI